MHATDGGHVSVDQMDRETCAIRATLIAVLRHTRRGCIGLTHIGPQLRLDLIEQKSQVFCVPEMPGSLPGLEVDEDDMLVRRVRLFVRRMRQMVVSLHPCASIAGAGH